MANAQQIFLDLLNIEVNTIVTPSITAETMPSLPFALHDIIEDYAGALAAVGAPLDRYFGPTRAQLLAEADARYADEAARKRDAEFWQAAELARAQVSGESRFTGTGSELWPYLPNLRPLLYKTDFASHRPRKDWRFSMREVTNGWDSFERLRLACDELVDAGKVPTDGAEVVTRVLNACEVLKYIVQGIEQRFPPGQSKRRGDVADWGDLIPRTRRELVADAQHHKRVPQLLRSEDYRIIRKAWEIGVEHVLVQTTVQLDGDVVTRISSQLLHEHADEVRALVLSAHGRGVDIGLSHWRSLVQTSLELFGSLLDRVVSR